MNNDLDEISKKLNLFKNRIAKSHADSIAVDRKNVETELKYMSQVSLELTEKDVLNCISLLDSEVKLSQSFSKENRFITDIECGKCLMHSLKNQTPLDFRKFCNSDYIKGYRNICTKNGLYFISICSESTIFYGIARKEYKVCLDLILNTLTSLKTKIVETKTPVERVFNVKKYCSDEEANFLFLENGIRDLKNTLENIGCRLKIKAYEDFIEVSSF